MQMLIQNGPNNNLFSDEYSNSIQKRDALTMKLKFESSSFSELRRTKNIFLEDFSTF